MQVTRTDYMDRVAEGHSDLVQGTLEKRTLLKRLYDAIYDIDNF